MSTSKCDNCGKVWDNEELEEIKDLKERVDEDTIYYPTGQCPDCGCLCYSHEDGKGYDLRIQVRGQSKAALLATLDSIRKQIVGGKNYNWASEPEYRYSIRGVGDDGPSDA